MTLKNYYTSLLKKLKDGVKCVIKLHLYKSTYHTKKGTVYAVPFSLLIIFNIFSIIPHYFNFSFKVNLMPSDVPWHILLALFYFRMSYKSVLLIYQNVQAFLVQTLNLPHFQLNGKQTNVLMYVVSILSLCPLFCHTS